MKFPYIKDKEMISMKLMANPTKQPSVSSLRLTLAIGLGLATFQARAYAGEITLQEAIERAMNRSVQVGAAEADLQAQVERKRQTWTTLGPRVTAAYTEARFTDTQAPQALPGGIVISRPDSTKTGTINVTQPVTGLYARAEVVRQAYLVEELASENLRRVKRDGGFRRPSPI